MQTSEKIDVGYFAMVDMVYPGRLHDSHNDFPLSPEKSTIDAKMLSQYQLHLGKQNYACRYSLLKFYYEQVLQVTKLHKTLKFNQSDFMKCYIEQNSDVDTR